MRTLPTVTLQACEIAGENCWKVFFPYQDDAIRSKLEQLEMRYHPGLKTSVLPFQPGLTEKLKSHLDAIAFVVVRQAGQVLAPANPNVTPSDKQVEKKQSADTGNSGKEPTNPPFKSEGNSLFATLVTHKGEERIKIAAPFTNENKQLLKTIPGSKWSQTMKSWHVPKTKEAWQQVKATFPGIVVEKGENQQASNNSPNNPRYAGTITARFSAQVPNRVYLQTHVWLDEWNAFLNNIPGARWLPAEKYWEIPKTKENAAHCKIFFKEILLIDRLTPVKMQSVSDNNTTANTIVGPGNTDGQKYASTGQPDIQLIEKEGMKMNAVVGDTVTVRSWNNNWIAAYVPYDKKAWIDHIKRIPGRKYSYEHTCWMLPLNRETIQELTDYFGERLCITFALPDALPEKYTPTGERFNRQPENETYKLNEIQRLAVTALEERLILESKRPRTIKTYKNSLSGLLAFYPAMKPSQISLPQINAYIIYVRKSKNYSNSSVNTLINALNAFYGRVLEQMDKVLQLERPPKQKRLPNVLSKEEVEQLLNATENDKHKCMLLLIYAAGLRKGELLRLRVRDLSPSRQCLFVKDGKGGKDRYSFYPPDAQRLVSEYIKKHKPRYWLFEGQTGDQYSETSLQIIFENARQKSGVNPFITIHGLRHSFATHLVYDGVPLHEVKQLLGHENIKTTEIYLHVANRTLQRIKSPLEGMKI